MERQFCEVVPVYVRPQSMVDEQACFGVIGGSLAWPASLVYLVYYLAIAAHDFHLLQFHPKGRL